MSYFLNSPLLIATAINIGLLLLAIPIGLSLYAVISRVVKRTNTVETSLGTLLIHRSRHSGRWLLCLLTLSIALNFMLLPLTWKNHVRSVLQPVIIGMFGWLMVSIVLAIAAWLRTRFSWQNKEDNLAARRISTQLRVFTNIALFFIILITGIGMAMTIPSLKNIGLSLFASAGVAGLVIGMAARPALSNVIAGVQLALTQPIRLDDVVIVEGEWGRIEEITATYVIVVIWDLRRLVVPLSYFIEKPFQNWTHTSSDLLGTVFLYVDYTIPVQGIRDELRHILEVSPKWDKKVCVLQVTDMKENTLELRALMSARNASLLWDLRCDVREKLVDYIQRHHPQSLPHVRAEIPELQFVEKKRTA